MTFNPPFRAGRLPISWAFGDQTSGSGSPHEPAQRATCGVPGYRGRRRSSGLHRVDYDHLVIWSRGVKALDLGGAAFEHAALVDVALVGDLVFVDRGRRGEEQHAGDPL